MPDIFLLMVALQQKKKSIKLKAKSRVQCAAKIVLHECNYFWKSNFWFYLFGSVTLFVQHMHFLEAKPNITLISKIYIGSVCPRCSYYKTSGEHTFHRWERGGGLPEFIKKNRNQVLLR